jgi:ubiquinone biosynthesis monooxygenase Coq7
MSGSLPPSFTVDALLQAADSALRALFVPARAARSPEPLPEAPSLTETERRHVAGLMRVNHAGEIAAQALYHGQALMARSPATREYLLQAAAEEGDHLAWCEQRLKELRARTSVLNPFWYAGSFAIGAAAAALSDALSLGFLTETERQVESHLAEHLGRLPSDDQRTRRILETMQSDEVKHAGSAEARGAAQLPRWARASMALASKVMTRTAYWV